MENKNNLHHGFTLAEMMIVMLILTIILAAFAPLMTKRKTVDLSNPWRWAANNSDLYFGTGDTQSVMIGQTAKGIGEPNSRMIIKQTKDNQPMITFKYIKDDGTLSTHLYMYKDNIVLGDLKDKISGWANTGFGKDVFAAITNGSQNTAFGDYAMHANTEGGWNTAVGAMALCSNTKGSSNIAIGYQAGKANTEGKNNVAIGSYALNTNEKGENNTAIGGQACKNIKDNKYVTCIGANSGPKEGEYTTNNTIYIGTASDTVYIPGKLVVDKQAVLGRKENANNVTILRYKTFGNDNLHLRSIEVGSGDDDKMYWGSSSKNESYWPSDKRLKYIVGDSNAGLEQVRKLKVFDYIYKNDEEKSPHVGVIAQDLQEIFPNAVKIGYEGYLQIRMEDMFYAVVNAVKELDVIVQNITAQVKDLIAKVADIDTQVQTLRAENSALKERVNLLEQRLEKLEQAK